MHRCSSIKAAEACKVIENTQRDLNIALMNELAIIFDKIGIDTSEVLEAAGTKWNFLKFKPGLVGGHCIGVDPYYLTHKAEMLGYHPQVILAGRRINDGMGKFIAEQTIKQMIAAGSYDQGRQGQRARPDLQGKLRRPAQQQGRRHHPRAAELRRRGRSCTTRRPTPSEALHEYGVRAATRGTTCRVPTPSSRGRAPRVPGPGAEALAASLRPGGCVHRRQGDVRRGGTAGSGAARLAAVTLAGCRAGDNSAPAGEGTVSLHP